MPLGKTWLSCMLGMWESILPFCLPLLPGLLGLFDLGLNSEQQQGRSQQGVWFLIPNEVGKQKWDRILKKERKKRKQETLAQVLHQSPPMPHTPSHNLAFPINTEEHFEHESVGSPLLPSCPTPKGLKQKWGRHVPHVPHTGAYTDFFLLTNPSIWTCGFIAPLQLSKDDIHYRADYFLQGCYTARGGLWNPPCM